MDRTSGNKETTRMATEVKSNQHSKITSPFRNPTALSSQLGLSSSGNSSNLNTNYDGSNKTKGSFQNHQPTHHLHHQDGPPTLHRRNSGSSTASSTKSKGKQVSMSKNMPSHNKKGNEKLIEHNISAKKTSKKPRNPLRVLGIALIVDQKGSGARMLARYPTSEASVKKDEDEDHEDSLDPLRNMYEDHEDDEGNGDDRLRRKNGDDDLFFTLTARQMAKLFRAKRSLCNQPMTLRVNKTIFCCHAVLLEESNQNTHHHSSSNSDANDNNSDKDNKSTAGTVSSEVGEKKSDTSSDDGDDDKNDSSLRLFSVVVALAPSTQQAALPFSSFWDVGGFGGGEDRSDLERYIRQGRIPSSKTPDSGNTSSINKSSKAVIQKDKHKSLHVDNSNTNSRHLSKEHRASDKNEEKHLKQTNKKKKAAARLSSAFLAIRRVHISLIRFCRALEREEHRCGYVTHQSRVLFQIRSERQKQLDQIRSRNPREAAASAMATTTNSGGGSGDRSPYPERGVGLVGGAHHHHHTPRHSRQNSFISTPGGGGSLLSDATLKKAFDKQDLGGEPMGSVEQEQEKEQEILELMLACNPQGQQQQQLQHRKLQHGNLVRDLVAVFHSLSRNDHEYPPTPSSLLCERDAVVYVNQHFAIPIDAAGLNGHSQSSCFPPDTSSSWQHKIGSVPMVKGGIPVIRPYYTLLFPHASPSELLQTFHSSGSAPPQQMEYLLLTVNPQKPLTQIATDANLPIHTTMQIASFLIAHGACTTSPVVSSRSRLTCFGSDSMQRIPELALEFSQTFPGVSLFGVVSFLTTSSRRLGDAMAILADTENGEGEWLRKSLLASPKYGYNNYSHGEKVSSNETTTADKSIGKSTNQALLLDEKNESSYSPTVHTSWGGGPKPSGIAQDPTPMSVHEWLKDLEELLFSIAVWLLSHRVLVQLQEYMVVVAEITSLGLVPVSGDGDNDSSSSLILSSPLMTENVRTMSVHSTTGVSSNTTVKNKNSEWDENLFKELMEMEYLNGDISIMALSWRMAIDPRKLRHWALRHKRVRIISRVPSSGDDWEPATAKGSLPFLHHEPSPLPVPPFTFTNKLPS